MGDVPYLWLGWCEMPSRRGATSRERSNCASAGENMNLLDSCFRALEGLPSQVQGHAATRSAIEPTVRSILDTLICRELEKESVALEPFFEETVQGMLEKLFGMPQYLALGMVGLTLVFDRYGVLRGGRFCSLSLDQRHVQLRKWKFSPVGPMRDFVAFYEKMGTFVYYSHVEEGH